MSNNYNEIDWNEVNERMSSRAVGRRIAAFRADMGLSLEQVAERMNKSRSTVSRIERGTQELTVEQLYDIAEILQVSSFDLLTD